MASIETASRSPAVGLGPAHHEAVWIDGTLGLFHDGAEKSALRHVKRADAETGPGHIRSDELTLDQSQWIAHHDELGRTDEDDAMPGIARNTNALDGVMAKCN
jgi:hypothetical protein